MPKAASDKLKKLIDKFLHEAPSLSSRDKVRALVGLQRAFLSLIRVTIFPDVRAGKPRILAFLRENVGEIVTSDELQVVAGIKDYPRRIRELRVEDGWPIVSGASRTSMAMEEADSGLPITLRPDQYLLLEDKQDANAAARWRLANTIRRQNTGVKEKLLQYFRANVGVNINVEELRYVANNSGDWPRRTRELRTEDGWPVVTNNSGDPLMPRGTYKLVEDRQEEPHDRAIPETVRREVMKRDGSKCQWRGCGWPEGFPESDHRFLEVHHIVPHAAGGKNTVENLVTLCNLHHDEAHRPGRLLDLEQA